MTDYNTENSVSSPDEEYITLSEATARLGLTKNTVKGRISKFKIETRKADDGQTLVPLSSLNLIGSVTKPVINPVIEQAKTGQKQPITASEQNITDINSCQQADNRENSCYRTDTTAVEQTTIGTEQYLQQGITEVQQQIITELRAQITLLQKVISDKDEEIAFLRNSLNDSQRLVENQQKIQIVNALPDAHKEHWWQKLFKKDKTDADIQSD